jgi:hypothetical protein
VSRKISKETETGPAVITYRRVMFTEGGGIEGQCIIKEIRKK